MLLDDCLINRGIFTYFSSCEVGEPQQTMNSGADCVQNSGHTLFWSLLVQ